MKILHKICFGLALIISLTACQKQEEKLVASTIEEAYQLRPTGELFDETIANYYQKYGTYTFYSFTDKEAYWTPTGYKSPVLNANGTWVTGFEVTEAEKNYIPAQLDLIQKMVFNYYSAAYLKEFLPARILLCQQVDSVYTGFDFTTVPVTYIKTRKSVPAWNSFDQISIGYGDQKVEQMTKKDSLFFMGYVHLRLLKSLVDNRRIKATTAFSDLTNYNLANTTQQLAYNKGIITVYYNSPTANSDWGLYMEAMLTRSEAKLTMTTTATDQTLNGILNSVKNSTGIIRKRYDIVRNYYINNYGVDLQKIGNIVNP